MIRQAGMKPELTRWNNPGNSFRRDRSPVAPTRTTTCGYRGPTLAAFFANMWTHFASSMIVFNSTIRLKSFNLPIGWPTLNFIEFSLSAASAFVSASSCDARRCGGCGARRQGHNRSRPLGPRMPQQPNSLQGEHHGRCHPRQHEAGAAGVSRPRFRSVFRSTRCAVRTSSAVRCRGRTVHRLRPTALRGPGLLGPRPPLPAPGSRPNAPTTSRTPSASTTCRWSS